MESIVVLALAEKPVGLLGERNMRWYLGGQLVSLTGTMLQSAVLSLLVIKLAKPESGASFWVGLVWALGLLPGAFLAPFAGIFVDRVNKAWLLKLTSLLGLFQSFTLAILVMLNLITIPLICLLSLLMGFINAFDAIGRNAIMKEAVIYPHNLRPATSLFTSLYNLAQMVGPGLAGPIVLSLGYTIAFGLNGLSFLAVIGAVSMMNFAHVETRPMETASKTAVWLPLREGLAHVFGKPSLRLCILLSATVCICGFSYNTILSVIAKEMFPGDYRVVYSWLGIATGLGGFLGSLVSTFWVEKFSARLFVVSGSLLLGFCLLLFSQTHDLGWGIALMLLAGFGFMISFSVLRSSVMHLADPRLVGRVMGITLFFFFGGMMLGAFLAGLLAKYFGCPSVLLLSGSAMIAIALVTPFLPGIDEVH